jgi:hypothetical protein
MIPFPVYEESRDLLANAGLTYLDDNGQMKPVAFLEQDEVPDRRDIKPDDSGVMPALVAWSMWATNAAPLENPRIAPWTVSGWVQVHILCPSNLGAQGRVMLCKAVSDVYRLGSLSALLVDYGEQAASPPTNDQSLVYSITTMQIAWEASSPMPQQESGA